MTYSFHNDPFGNGECIDKNNISAPVLLKNKKRQSFLKLGYPGSGVAFRQTASIAASSKLLPLNFVV